VTDHRLKQSWHNIDRIFAGEIEPIITALQKFFDPATLKL